MTLEPNNSPIDIVNQIIQSLALDGVKLYTDGESILVANDAIRQPSPSEQELIDKYTEDMIPLLPGPPPIVGVEPQPMVRRTVGSDGITGVIPDSMYNAEPFFDLVNTWNGETGDIVFSDYVNTTGTILEDSELLQDQPGNRLYWIMGKDNPGSSFGHTQSPESIYEEEWWAVVNYTSSGNTAARYPVAYGWNWGGGSGSSLDPVPGWTKAKYAGVVNADYTDPQYAMQWKVISDNLHAVDQTIKPSEGGTYDLGSSDNKWKDIHCEQLFADTLDSISFNSTILENDELLQDQPAGQSYWIKYDHDQAPPPVDGEIYWNVVNYNSSGAYYKARFPIARGWNGSSDGGWTKTQYSGRGNESSWSSGDILWKITSSVFDTSTISSDLVPSDDLIYNIGTGDKRWENIHCGTLHADASTIKLGGAEIKSDGTDIVVSNIKIGTVDSNITLQKSGSQLAIKSGGVQLSSSSVAIEGAAEHEGVIITGGATFSGGASFGGQTFSVGGTATFLGRIVGSTGGVVVGGSTFDGGGSTFGGTASFLGGIIGPTGGVVVGGSTFESGGATFSGTVVAPILTATTGVNATSLNMNNNYALPTVAGATGDVLMIANDGDLEFESLKTTATFIVDSDVPLATGIRYKGLYAVPMAKMDVVSIELRSHDVSPAGSGDSLSVALKFIRTGLESASPTIQGTVETVVIPLGGQYHTAVTEANVDTPSVGSGNAADYLVVDVVSNAGNHANFTMLVKMEARP